MKNKWKSSKQDCVKTCSRCFSIISNQYASIVDVPFYPEYNKQLQTHWVTHSESRGGLIREKDFSGEKLDEKWE